MPYPKILYKGDVLSNTTNFMIVQNLLDKPKEAKLFHLVDLETVVEALLFHERVLIMEPRSVTKDIEFTMPKIAAELVEKKIMEIHTPKIDTTHVKELHSLLEEAPELRNSKLVKTVYLKGFGDYLEELATLYYPMLRLKEQALFPEFLKCLRKNGITDRTVIPLYIQLLQTRLYLKWLHSMDQKGRRMPYLPHIGRVSLTKWMVNLYESRTLPVARQIIREMELSERQKIEALNRTRGSTLELDLPILTTIVLSQCKEPSDILDEILNMRKDNKVERFRDYCNRFQNAIYVNDRRAMEKYDQKLKTALSRLSETRPKNGAASQILKSIPTLAFDVFRIDIPSILSKLAGSSDALLAYLGKRDLLFLGDLYNKLYSVRRSTDEFERIFKVKFKL